jgi:ribosomal protein S18 acetylase RimI-like enzyme
MALTYFKRYRMEIKLLAHSWKWPGVPEGYHLLPWDDSLLEAHAEVKFASFRDEMDASIFPCFTELSGCCRLMSEIVGKPGFLPAATWLAVRAGANGGPVEPCGTVQGLRDRTGLGSIQNIGVLPEHRGCGLGTVLLFRALRGFRQAGLTRVFLEVTADNEGAIRLYERLGFAVVKTVFTTVEVACP